MGKNASKIDRKIEDKPVMSQLPDMLEYKRSISPRKEGSKHQLSLSSLIPTDTAKDSDVTVEKTTISAALVSEPIRNESTRKISEDASENMSTSDQSNKIIDNSLLQNVRTDDIQLELDSSDDDTC